MTTKRYTAKQMRVEASFAEFRGDGRITAQMLRQAAEDCNRLDWLAMQFVDVRVPGVYGSRLAFSGVPKIDIEGLDEAPFDIRSAIDIARTQEGM
jgi:hypothetical protein